jgi:hypothetical protein
MFGVVSVLLLPLLFIPLLGYAISSTRAAQRGASGPPPWRLDVGLLTDGLWTAVILLLTFVPFGVAFLFLARALNGIALVVGFFALALLWGFAALPFLPHATAAFAASGRPADLFNVAASIRSLTREFPTWNAVVAAIVTGWAVGLACVGLFCVGIVPGVFYAILVSAHAAAALDNGQGSRPGPAAR